MKKKVLLVLLLGLLIAGGYLGFHAIREGSGSGTLTLYGNVDIREVQMAFRVPGRIKDMFFEEGDAIEPGDLLATLDDRPQREALAVAEARIAEAQAKLDLLNTGSRPQEIEQARARVAESEAGLANAEHEFQRQAALVKEKLSSQSQLDQTRSLRDQWAARLDQTREALNLAQEGFRSEEIVQAQAAVAAAAAQRDQAATQLSDTRLLSPSAGTIMTRVLEPGAMVGVGAPVYTLSLDEKIYVRAYVDEAGLGKVVPGTAVLITTDGGDRSYTGQVGFVSPRAEFTPKSVETAALRTDLVYRLRIVVTDADPGLRQGMPVTIHLKE
ncbi:MAG: secretion protein HlyD [Halioglobus sp.]